MYPFYPIVNINLDPASTTCFADYSTELFGREISQRERNILRQRLSHKIGILLDLLYKEGYRTFLCPVGGVFGCVAASAVLDLKAGKPDTELVPVQATIQSREAGNAFNPFMRSSKAGRIGRRLPALQVGDMGNDYSPSCSGGDGYSIENALMIGLSSTVVTFFPGTTPALASGQIPASLALAKQLDLRIINLSPDREERKYENRVEPFISAALLCRQPGYGVEYLCGRWILEQEYGMESGDKDWRHMHTYSNFECEWNLQDDGTAEILYNAGSIISDTFLYDQEIGALTFSSKRYTVKDLTGNHLELLDVSTERGIRLLSLRKIHWNRPPASIQRKDAGYLIGQWLHAGTYVKDDACVWQPLPDNPDFPDEWIFVDSNILTARYSDKSEDCLRYAYYPLNRELFIEQNRELCVDDIYRVEELSPTQVRLYLMDGVDIFPEQCRIMIQLEKE